MAGTEIVDSETQTRILAATKPWEIVGEDEVPEIIRPYLSHILFHEFLANQQGGTSIEEVPDTDRLLVKQRIDLYNQRSKDPSLIKEKRETYKSMHLALITRLAMRKCARCGRLQTADKLRDVGGKLYCSEQIHQQQFPGRNPQHTHTEYVGGCAYLAKVGLDNERWVKYTESTPCPVCKMQYVADHVRYEDFEVMRGHNPHTELQFGSPNKGYPGVSASIVISLVCCGCLIERHRSQADITAAKSKLTEARP
jgi:hypothetical protein